MTEAEQFQEYAAECMALAGRSKCAQERLAFLELAETWLCAATETQLRQSLVRRCSSLRPGAANRRSSSNSARRGRPLTAVARNT
jgi:hypothetical protein